MPWDHAPFVDNQKRSHRWRNLFGSVRNIDSLRSRIRANALLHGQQHA
jgi:hypothetical protein